jgi:hypothetical protein
MRGTICKKLDYLRPQAHLRADVCRFAAHDSQREANTIDPEGGRFGRFLIVHPCGSLMTLCLSPDTASNRKVHLTRRLFVLNPPLTENSKAKLDEAIILGCRIFATELGIWELNTYR